MVNWLAKSTYSKGRALHFPALLVLSVVLATPALASQWIRVYDDGRFGQSRVLRTSPDGGAVVGAIEQDPSPSATLRNIPLGFKIDAHGRPVWQRSLDVPGAGVQSLVGESDLDAGLVLAGSAGNPAAIAQAWVAKIDREGQLSWSRSFAGWGGASAVAVSPDRSYLLGGWWAPSAGAARHAWAARLDAHGNVLGQWTYGTGEVTAARYASGGGYVLAVQENPPRLIRLDPGGAILWERTYGGTGATVRAIEIADDGGFVTAGSVSGNASAWIMRLDDRGGVVWEGLYPSGWHLADIASIRKDADGGYLVGSGNLAFKIEDTGTVVWQRFVDLEVSDIGPSLDGGYWIAGTRWDRAFQVPSIEASRAAAGKLDAAALIPQCPMGSTPYNAAATSIRTPNGRVSDTATGIALASQSGGLTSSSGTVTTKAVCSYDIAGTHQGLWWNSVWERGWGLNVAQQGETLFATWYTYDTAGRDWWLSMTARRSGPETFSGTLYETRGPSFASAPFDAGSVTRTAVGIGTLSFDLYDGTFAYVVNGIARTKSIQRQTFGTSLSVCTFGAPPENATNLWWAGLAESGWGLNIDQQGERMFATWFTYDIDGRPMWLSVTALPVAGAQGRSEGDLFRTSGPHFDAPVYDPGTLTYTKVGIATFDFAAGFDIGQLHTTVQLPGMSVPVTSTRSIVRQIFNPPGTGCF